MRNSVQYIAFIHGNSVTSPSADEWTEFIQDAQESGMFQGGSALGERHAIGGDNAADSTKTIAGFMRFDSDDSGQLKRLLNRHPVVVHGGTLELREMPVT